MYQQSKVLIQHLLAQITRALTMTSSPIHGRITIFTIFYLLMVLLRYISGFLERLHHKTDKAVITFFFIRKPKLFRKSLKKVFLLYSFIIEQLSYANTVLLCSQCKIHHYVAAPY